MARMMALFLAVGLVTASVLITGCSEQPKMGGQQPTQQAAGQSGQTTEQPIVIKLAYVVAETQSSHIAGVEFKKQMEEKSGGRFKVELYPNGQLGSDRQAIEAVSLGTIQMTVPALAVVSGFEKSSMVLDLPFLFKDRASAHRALDGELGKKIADKLPAIGLKSLAFPENGFRNITNNRGPITEPKDLRGLKIRTMENPVHMEAFRALGANPTPMAFGELYTALQQKTVDAQENPISLIYTTKFYEVQKYCTLSGHVYAATTMLVNNDFFNKLPPDLQKLLQDSSIAYRDNQRKLALQQDTEWIGKIKEAGMNVNELTAGQKQLFVEATKPVYDKFKGELGSDLIDLAIKANQ